MSNPTTGRLKLDYTEIVRMSKEIPALENEMDGLKELLVDFKALPSSLGANITEQDAELSTDLALGEDELEKPSTTGFLEEAPLDLDSARFARDLTDDITVAIALRDWEKAVELVEEGLGKAATMPLLASALPPLKKQLKTSLLDTLFSPLSRTSSVVQTLTLLNRLGAGAAARSAFLDMRTKVIRELVHKIDITFEGHEGTYIAEISALFFTGIKNTADWYMASFKENEAASLFTTWAKSQIEVYCEIFRKVVYSEGVEPKIVDEAIRDMHIRSRELLEAYGLDFKYLLDKVLVVDNHTLSHME
ncbi:Cullin repeat-like-containing domain protein [Ephemerocybe angulata]|uniref:Cullin repeat-like-containing domain protein n=1 Tax=Ephemerocybe angulata TaxID=980116 RepID=A0A8H6IJK4_9AGAR|nr:Cullin repeat-like-containing domain protein [Tulosesus angulatus]